jgi:predicted RNase H-like nuclease (RuvC/YqgF family)
LTGVRQELRERLVGDLRHENDQLSLKLARLGRAARGLAVELADARRELRIRQRRIRQLEAENAKLGGVAHGLSVADDARPAGATPSLDYLL